MTAIDKIRSALRSHKGDEAGVVTEADPEGVASHTKGSEEINVNNDSSSEEHIDANNQRGVQDVEAVTMVWSKQSLIAVFIL